MTRITNCYFHKCRDEDAPLFSDEDENGRIIVKMDRYVVMPLEAYNELLAELGRGPVEWDFCPLDKPKTAVLAKSSQPQHPKCAECGGKGQVPRSYGWIPCDACNGEEREG